MMNWSLMKNHLVPQIHQMAHNNTFQSANLSLNSKTNFGRVTQLSSFLHIVQSLFTLLQYRPTECCILPNYRPPLQTQPFSKIQSQDLNLLLIYCHKPLQLLYHFSCTWGAYQRKYGKNNLVLCINYGFIPPQRSYFS